MKQFELKRVKDLLNIDLTNLIIESKKEGFLFLERLINDYKNGTNIFSKPGEFLYGVFNQEGSVIAIGGINKDPFSPNERIGRLRRFYVSRDYRRKGVGRSLVTRILKDASEHYEIIVLYTDTEHANKFYTSLGFIKDNSVSKSTHSLNL
ncbi:GNAT family N-acetyltransferase [Priestia megaterium]|uniref:GNAT family N-acetyltransferase n=1 Tax=Priestia megaterium TaxID=1404 RepID=UPI002730F8EA|nr:GNAT family N-acetyltransferase [Priestia megaterium]MDP1442176.1 GNAT family N-acetyltransferase [Priestia megaterium]MDP1471234.1 GNAT family N-acetyltransferase [Priestia megaterium]